MVRFFDFINVSSKARNAYADRVSPRKVVMPVKSGVLASLLFSVLFISGPVFADAPIPTLDSLKGQEIPDSDPVQYYHHPLYLRPDAVWRKRDHCHDDLQSVSAFDGFSSVASEKALCLHPCYDCVSVCVYGLV